MQSSTRLTGIRAALISALFLGMAPVLGKKAILLGYSPLAVVAIRTTLAAILLLVIVSIFRRPFLFIYPAGLLGCGLAGAINGIGSVLYYLALGRLNASIGQLLYSLYPVFLATWFILDRQRLGVVTYIRMALSIVGVVFLTFSNGPNGGIDWIGVALMLTASAMYALHLPINQRVLYDIPAPTVTLYTLLAMSAVVIPAYLIFDRSLPPLDVSIWPVIGLTMVTFFSRLTLFLGVKHLGGMQTALLGLSELLVTLVVSMIWLRETMHSYQWIGAVLLTISLILIGIDKAKPETHSRALSWLRSTAIPPNIPWGPRD
jgi:drug/metabolite transporter (DMT)-like permease